MSTVAFEQQRDNRRDGQVDASIPMNADLMGFVDAFASAFRCFVP